MAPRQGFYGVNFNDRPPTDPLHPVEGLSCKIGPPAVDMLERS